MLKDACEGSEILLAIGGGLMVRLVCVCFCIKRGIVLCSWYIHR